PRDAEGAARRSGSSQRGADPARLDRRRPRLDSPDERVHVAPHVVDVLEPPRRAGIRVFTNALARLRIAVERDIESLRTTDPGHLLRELFGGHRHPVRLEAVRDPPVPARRAT